MRRIKRLLFTLTALLVATASVEAATLSFQLSNPSLIAEPRDSATFAGTTSNGSSAALGSSDLSFNFFGFGPHSVTPIKNLGLAESFSSPSSAPSGMRDLIHVDPAAAPPGSNSAIQAHFESTSSDLSAAQIIVSANPSDSSSSSAPAPAFSIQGPMSGVLGSEFVAILPLVNTGSGTAGGVSITSVSLGDAALSDPVLPQSLRSLAANDFVVLDLKFEAAKLVVGTTYTLTVRGTYRSGSQALGFAVNQPLIIATPDESLRTELEHWVARDAVRQKFASLPHLNQDADNQALLNFIRSRPEFVSSGIHAGSSSIWAIFADGERYIIANNLALPAHSAAHGEQGSSSSTTVRTQDALSPGPQQGRAAEPSAQQPIIDVPVSSTSHILNALGPGWAHPIVAEAVEGWLRKQNYQFAADASVKGFKQVGGDGILYISSHVGTAGDGSPDDPFQFAIGTGQWTSPEADQEFASDLKLTTPLRLPDLTVIGGIWAADLLNQQPILEDHYAITAQFARHYWKRFNANSLVYVNTCYSDGPEARDFKQAVFDTGASVYVGWEGLGAQQTLGDMSANTAAFVFDRLLGANDAAYFPETPPQRPFDLQSIFNDFKNHTFEGSPLGVSGVGAAQSVLKIEPNPGDGPTQFGLLAPSIAFMDADPPGQPNKLRIWGLFGNDQSQTTVTVGGQKLDNVLLNKGGGVLTADLPPSGPSSAGDVVVAVRDHSSNVARVTEWQGTFRYTVAEAGTLSRETTFNLAFRGDIRKYRLAIHQDPVEPTGAMFQISSLSRAQFACNGTGVDPSTDPKVTATYKYSGSGTLTPFFPTIGGTLSPGPGEFLLDTLVTSSRSMTMFIPTTAGFPCSWTEHVVDTHDNPPAVTDVGPVAMDLCMPPGELSTNLELDENAVIHAGPVSFNLPASWCTPPNGTSKAGLNWNAIQPKPGTAPDPASAR
jgi:hypothetical protein